MGTHERAATTLATFGEWTFSHQLAARLVVTEDCLHGAKLHLLSTPQEVIQAVLDGRSEYGLIPYHNKYANSRGVPSSYRMLMQPDINVHCLIRHDIVVMLAAPAGSTLADVHTIRLMPVLEPQCSEFLGKLNEVRPDTADIQKTADAMLDVSTRGIGYAALGTLEAAEHFQLPVLQAGVQNAGNVTLFLLISRASAPSGGDRLVGFEVDSAVSADRVIGQVVQPALESSGWLATGTFVLEDRAQLNAQGNNYFVMVPASPSSNLNLEPQSPFIVNWRDLGRV